MRGRAPANRPGFTLLELLITAGLCAGLAMITAHFWRFYSYQLGDLKTRARAAQELRLAVDSITHDLGSTVGATPVGDDAVMLCRDAGDIPNGSAQWGEPDQMVLYSLVDGQLVRDDQSLGVAIVVADGVRTFAAEDVSESVLRVTIAVGFGDVTRQATLMWGRP